MTEQQLKKALSDKERFQDELNVSKNIIKVSEACDGYLFNHLYDIRISL